jgi:hypothetical protein
MGACISSPDEDTERNRTLHREAEKLLKEVCFTVAIIGACYLTNPTFAGKD